STKSLASFKPKPVMSLTTLTTANLLAPPDLRITSKDVFSSAPSAPAPPPAPGAATTAAAAGSIPYSSLRIVANSFTSLTVKLTNCSANALTSAIVLKINCCFKNLKINCYVFLMFLQDLQFCHLHCFVMQR